MSARCLHCGCDVEGVLLLSGCVSHVDARACAEATRKRVLIDVSNVLDQSGLDGVSMYLSINGDFSAARVRAELAGLFRSGGDFAEYEWSHTINQWLLAGLAECDRLRAFRLVKVVRRG